MTASVLVVDDDQEMCRLLQSGLEKLDVETVTATSSEQALRLFSERDFDAVLTDLRMGGRTGIELCRAINEQRPDVPVVVMTAFGSLEAATQAIRAGAYDFVTKPFELDRIRVTMERALQHRDLQRRVERLEETLAGTQRVEGLLGKSAAMQRVFDLVDRVAASAATVLIRGPSGTGKELVARAIHERGPRQTLPFVAINCAAMPANLLESELFGHVKGAFTDARSDRSGMFEVAKDGTLFLDEIGEMPLELQPKLLRALQERSFRPVGSSHEIPLEARIVAATNRDLEQAVAHGLFREDLYYRIQVIEIDVPPLRARGNDILLLAQHFTTRFAAAAGKTVTGITAPVAKKLLAYPWPGNVRELQNCIERAVTLTRFSEITMEDLPERIANAVPEPASHFPEDLDALESMDELERRYVIHVHEATGRNKSLTSKILGFNRKTLYRKLIRYGVEAGPEDDDP
ncbi:MAG: sigma-54 dependent transcriptional regulator [Polyangiaceae bacterium]